MCGICGIFSKAGVEHDELRHMSQMLAHRGPDDEGFYIKGPIGLGYRRLSIIDLGGGWQPISNEDHTIWIVYNGEIYNYKALRKELEQKGHVFKTNGDTEVIVHLYEELGEKCVERLRGMFAFAIWDERTQSLFLARDRLGQKPLFYAQVGDTFYFASEVKAIAAVAGPHREIDFESIHHYLSLRFIPAPRTMFRNINKLAPGHYLVWRDGSVRIARYWNLSFRKKLALTEADFVDGLSESLSETVGTHLVSDVPVSAFLSGGLDSSTIVAVMSQHLPTPFKTFAIGVKEQSFNELPYARIVAERYGTDHIEQIAESNLMRLLPKMIWHLDEPSDPIAACMFHAAELASRHAKVVLCGDGGDELFAGFDRYRGVSYIDYYNLIPSLVRSKIIGPVIGSIPESFAYKSLSQQLRWVHYLSSLASSGERYSEATTFFRFNHHDKKALFNDEVWRYVDQIHSSNIIVEQFVQADADDVIDRMLYADFMTRLPEHSLMVTDRMTMAHSLEARAPFLDHSLVEYLAMFPSSMKIRGKTLKYVLRRLAADYLPEKIIHRQKQGFMFPVAYWFRNELYEPLKRFLMASHFVKDGQFKREKVLSLLEDHKHNKVDNHVRLWMLLNLEIWYQLYIEQNSLEAVEASMQDYF